MCCQGKINVYKCPDGHQTVTIDLVDGTTPMIIDCREVVLNASECNCGKQAYSSFYQCDQTLEPTHEWYFPKNPHKLKGEERVHVMKGGLLLRKIGTLVSCPPEIVKGKQGRNDACSCGSGKKFKNCCLKK